MGTQRLYHITTKCKDYSIIKHINEETFYIIYFYPSKYSVKDGYNGYRYSLLCNDISTTAIKDRYHIIRNRYYDICGSTAQRFSCNRCVPYKVYFKHCNSKPFRSKVFIMMLKLLVVPRVKRRVEE